MWIPYLSFALSTTTALRVRSFATTPRILPATCYPHICLQPSIPGRLMCGRSTALRLYWCTSTFELDSALLAVKLFQPSADLTQGEQLSDVLAIWLGEVLKEFDLDTKNLFCTVTDAGSDVKRLCLKVLESEWEWCFPHMLNCALVEVRATRNSKGCCNT